MYIYAQLKHCAVYPKPTQHCKLTVILKNLSFPLSLVTLLSSQKITNQASFLCVTIHTRGLP